MKILLFGQISGIRLYRIFGIRQKLMIIAILE